MNGYKMAADTRYPRNIVCGKTHTGPHVGGFGAQSVRELPQTLVIAFETLVPQGPRSWAECFWETLPLWSQV